MREATQTVQQNNPTGLQTPRLRQRFSRFALLAVGMIMTLLTLSGCATLGTGLESPQVKVVSIRMLPSQGFEQRIGIGLRISNPNAVTLSLRGISYQLNLQGYRVLSGVKNDIKPIDAYAEAPIELVAGLDLVGGLQLLQNLLQQPEEAVDYELIAKLDTGSLWLPALRVVESGRIALGNDSGQ